VDRYRAFDSGSLLFSPLAALACTLGAFPAVARWLRSGSCVCITELAAARSVFGDAVPVVRSAISWLQIAGAAECTRGDEVSRWNTEDLVSPAASYFPFQSTTPPTGSVGRPRQARTEVVALMIALGGLAAAGRARTMSQRVTRIEHIAGLSANLVSAVLVAAASRWGLPVSTTHVTMGGIFGVGVQQRRQTDWRIVRQIVLARVVTLPLGLICGLEPIRYWHDEGGNG
jgi:PiT family inorganic phosphate transporter